MQFETLVTLLQLFEKIKSSTVAFLGQPKLR